MAPPPVATAGHGNEWRGFRSRATLLCIGNTKGPGRLRRGRRNGRLVPYDLRQPTNALADISGRMLAKVTRSVLRPCPSTKNGAPGTKATLRLAASGNRATASIPLRQGDSRGRARPAAASR
jgi:hypothetical protein